MIHNIVKLCAVRAKEGTQGEGNYTLDENKLPFECSQITWQKE